ncbi:uncharacterized protein LOC129766156 [Toxorhynchites rutilus septentrionalis]|uniref:uncharacterized protein LOC129766156 n=1 Tax=Toxorhynchites rutilus septentrionalis TaxID=329112 RepID=UPI0024785E04|nr:uncharacterized protein LOC129766156 [Toxorhynchites rutilus septentrionalis]
MPNISATIKSASLKRLIVSMKDAQSSLNDIWRFVEGSKNVETDICQLEVRLEKLDIAWEKFSETLIDIKCHDDFDDEEDFYEKERVEFSDRYYQVKSFLLSKVRERQEQSSSTQSIPANVTMQHGTLEHVRLPQIRLQSFDGNIDQWLSFRDLYTSLIHCKTDLPDVEKFHYLKGCLQGEPKALIDPLPLTGANYEIAWDMLLHRYNNSKLLKKRQIQSLFQLPTNTKESAKELHTLLDTFDRAVKTLDQIVKPEDYRDLLLVNILTTRLDPITRRGWEELSANKEQETLKDLTDFLQRRVQMLDSLPSRIDDHKNNISFHPQQKHKQTLFKTSHYGTQSTSTNCPVCKEKHFLFQCNAFLRKTVPEKDAILKTHYLCRNCFRAGHHAKVCQSKNSCRNCGGRHHTLVCFRNENRNSRAVSSAASLESAPIPSTSEVANIAATDVLVSSAAHCFSSQVLLATAVVIVVDKHGNRYPVRALLDSGSESNFISERISQKLKVDRHKADVSVVGIAESTSNVKQTIDATVKSRVTEFSLTTNFLVLAKVTVNLPTANINTKGWNIPEGIQLADPSFCLSQAVDMILGVESFFGFFESGRKLSLGEGLPVLVESVFGWIISGGVPRRGRSVQVNCNTSALEELNNSIARFWSCEEIETAVNYSPEEARCEALFVQSIRRGEDGRYSVSLPKNEVAMVKLGNSKDIALRRLHGTERRLARDNNLREHYVEFMQEYLRLGHMKKIEDMIQGSVKRCFLPHHPVVKEDSTTTKVRVVFDASCPTSSGISLNDTLLSGPVIQEDLRSIILRSRTKQIMLVADVEKMFRQIYIVPEERPLQSILWRFSESEEIGIYELSTITYGTKPAPFLATRTLKQLSLDEGGNFPLAARAVCEDTYMDDVITGAEHLDDAVNLRIQLEKMMMKGGFKLRKWASNNSKVLEGIPEDNLAIRVTEEVDLDPDPAVKTLGLIWMPNSDTLKLKINIPTMSDNVTLTKRRVLSIIATLFDPLGLVGATITTAKIFMQLLWTIEDETGQIIGWDQPLSSTVGELWRNFQNQLPLLNHIRIERCVIIPRAIRMEIHCFSDASERAYGGCLYLRSLDATGNVMVRLLTSKSRVAPLKCQTIPRLELCGALLVSQLFKRVKESIKMNIDAYFWTDSTCVMRWIKASPTCWTTFVANRVSKIQTITNGYTWRHVPGIHNPADLISRGVFPEDIVNNKFWWNGPGWLELEQSKWPASNEEIPESADIEKRRTVVANPVSPATEFNEWFISKFSSYSDLLRKTAIWLRLMNLLNRENRITGFISTIELERAEFIWIRRVQQEVFPEELKALAKGDAVPRRSPLRWFNPYISADNILKVGGRLRHSNEAEDTKHPSVLPARHTLTRLLLKQYHERLLHAGPQLMMSAVRLRYWPLGGRNVAREIVHKCVKCFRSKPTLAQQFMGELPAARVRVSRPFLHSGVDYFGPVYIRPGPRRQSHKAYVAVFICLCTKAVHLELVSDLSTDRFIQALRRFVARRGKCSSLYSDNGTNFVGARNKLKELLIMLKDQQHREQVSKVCADEGMRWHFNPPSAPHFGGLWEAAVRSAKHHLLRVIGENPVSLEDMNTLLIQVEACLNSRPLTPLSDDPNDLEPLTPAHFLVGESLQAIPEPNLEEIPLNRLNQWQLIQRRLQTFWSRWRKEYLSQLQARTKRWRPAIKIEVGKLVIIKDDNLPPMRWKLGRIIEVHPGADGIVRVVTLKTANGNLKRPVEKICILPV